MGELVRFTGLADASVANETLGRIPVLIPAHNSERRIGGVIGNLASQHLPTGAWMDIYVCANACKDNTPEVSQNALLKLQEIKPEYQTHLIVTEVPGQAQALNRMVREAGAPEWVIEQQDDSYANLRAVATLALAAEQNPDLGVIGVVNKPIPTHKRCKSTETEAVMFSWYQLDNFSQSSVVDRLCAFRPGIVGEFPDIVSVDNYMVRRSVNVSGKFGLIDNPQARVYFRVPTRITDALRQQDMYTKGTKQFQREVVKMGLGDDPEDHHSRVKKVINILTDKSVPLKRRVQVVGLKIYAKIISQFADKIDPYTSSVRARIESSV